MSDIVVYRLADGSKAFTRIRRPVARVARALDRILFAHRIRHDPGELSDRLRRDIGLIRMAFAAAIVVPALVAASGCGLA